MVRPRGTYAPFHEWVDPNGYRLSDRVWRTSVDVRARIDRLVDYHISQGTGAVEIARLMEPFLTPGAQGIKTKTPYGTEGSFSARRLARSEISAAAGRATVNAASVNPFVESIQWVLSGSHPESDECDANARGGVNGDGIYPVADVPRYPNHPQCCLPGQLVQTRHGAVPIEKIEVGDEVLTHRGRYRRVLAAWATPHDGMIYDCLTGRGNFALTGNHPVLTRCGWVNAEDMQLGNEVLYASANIVHYNAILSIRQRHYTGPVYNMEVADDHSYTVNGAVVHNCMCSLQPVAAGNVSDLVDSLRAKIDEARGNLLAAVGGQEANTLAGIFNIDWLTRALLNGDLNEAITNAVQSVTARAARSVAASLS